MAISHFNFVNLVLKFSKNCPIYISFIENLLELLYSKLILDKLSISQRLKFLAFWDLFLKEKELINEVNCFLLN